MYYYLIDPKAYDGKNFEYDQSRLLALLHEYQVSGEAARVTPIRGVKDLVATALAHGVKTLVIVGGDDTFSRALEVFRGQPITVAFIPLNTKSEIAKILGMVGGIELAVQALAKRLINTFDIVQVSDSYFFTSLRFESPDRECRFYIDDSFRVSSRVLGGKIINADAKTPKQSERQGFAVDPRDGKVEVIVAGSLSWFAAWRYRRALKEKQFEILPGHSVLHAKSLKIESPQGMPLYMGNYLIARTPTEIKVIGESLRIVVGRGRKV